MPERETCPWLYCPVCGRRRPEIDGRAAPKAVPPSALLRRGWTRLLALDAAGRVTLPCSDDAVAWRPIGAANRAMDAGFGCWIYWLGHVRDILTGRYGGVGVQAFNRDPSRTKAEVIAVEPP